MYFCIFIVCLNTITSRIKTHVFFDVTDLQVVPQLAETMREHMGERISHMIRSIPFFANVQKLALLADLFSFREYAKDDILFWQGDEADAFYILIRGECAVYVKSVFIVHVGGTRCVPSSTANNLKRQARITLTVECIRTCLVLF